jgi:hypothetical protein
MDKQDIIKYVLYTKHNTNPNDLDTMLDSLIKDEDKKSEYTVTIIPKCDGEDITDAWYYDFSFRHREDYEEPYYFVTDVLAQAKEPKITLRKQYSPMTLANLTIMSNSSHYYVLNTEVAPIVISGNIEIDDFNDIIANEDCTIQLDFIKH